MQIISAKCKFITVKCKSWSILLLSQGLLNAVKKIFPNCDQKYCLRHIHANFQTAGFRGGDLKKYMYAASYAYTKHNHDIAMENMKAESKDAWAWLSKIPVSAWARHVMDTNCKTDLVVNNLSEVFNRFILDVRNKPIVTMIDGFRTKLMIRFQNKKEGVQSSRWEITPTYSERLENEKNFFKFCVPVCAGPGLWQVTSGEKTHAVNLEVRTCGCRKWDITNMPCNHAISAIYKAKQHLEDYVSAFFKKPMYIEAYSPLCTQFLVSMLGQRQTQETLIPQSSQGIQGGRSRKEGQDNLNHLSPKKQAELQQLLVATVKDRGTGTEIVVFH